MTRSLQRTSTARAPPVLLKAHARRQDGEEFACRVNRTVRSGCQDEGCREGGGGRVALPVSFGSFFLSLANGMLRCGCSDLATCPMRLEKPFEHGAQITALYDLRLWTAIVHERDCTETQGEVRGSRQRRAPCCRGVD